MSTSRNQQLRPELPTTLPTSLAPRVRQLYEYWQAKRQGRLMPSRADVEPYEITVLLPYLIIADLFTDPVRVRYRLAGTKVVESFGFSITGRWLDELDVNGGADFWVTQYTRLMATQAPVFGVASGLLGSVEVFRGGWALLPLSSDGTRVDQSLEIEDWTKGSPIIEFGDARIDWCVGVLD
jgi:hypothetical protein